MGQMRLGSRDHQRLQKISGSESVSNRNGSMLITGSSQCLSLIGLTLAMCSTD